MPYWHVYIHIYVLTRKNVRVIFMLDIFPSILTNLTLFTGKPIATDYDLPENIRFYRTNNFPIIFIYKLKSTQSCVCIVGAFNNFSRVSVLGKEGKESIASGDRFTS